jgi:hypothetical protein
LNIRKLAMSDAQEKKSPSLMAREGGWRMENGEDEGWCRVKKKRK